MFEPRDLWVGLFWDRRPGRPAQVITITALDAGICGEYTLKETGDFLHLYLCLIPCIVLHAWQAEKDETIFELR